MNKQQQEEIESLVKETFPDEPETVIQVMDLIDARLFDLIQSYKTTGKKRKQVRSSVTGQYVDKNQAKDPEHTVTENG